MPITRSLGDPMLGLLILGAGNWSVMIVVAGIVAMEKVAPNPILTVRISGLAIVVTGLTILVGL